MDCLDEALTGWSEMGLVIFPLSLKVVIFALLQKKIGKASGRFIPSATATTSVGIPPKLSTSLFSEMMPRERTAPKAQIPKRHARLETLF